MSNNKVITVDVNEIDPALNLEGYSETQARACGIDPSWVRRLEYLIAAEGQKTPIELLHIVGEPKDGEPKYRIHEGNHRFQAIHNLNASNRVTTPLKIRAKLVDSDLEDMDVSDREIDQLIKNRGEKLGNTYADVYSVMRRAIVDHHKVKLKKDMDHKDALKKIEVFIESKYPGRHDVKKLAREIFRDSPADNKKTRNYTTTTAMKQFNKLHGKTHKDTGEPIEWANSGKSVSENVVTYVCYDTKYLSRVIGQAIEKVISNPNIEKVYLVAFCDKNKGIGLSPNDIKTFRTQITAQVRKINTKWRHLVDEIHFLPQIVRSIGKPQGEAALEIVKFKKGEA